jgi:hypothetical protein
MTIIPINSHDPNRNATGNASGTAEKTAESPATRGRAPARARAREEPSNATPAAAAPSQRRDRLSDLLELVRPPELWSEPRPSLQQIWNYAAYGPWTDQSRTTSARVAGMAYAAFMVALTSVGYSLLWLVERPSRAALASVLAGLACLSWLI